MTTITELRHVTHTHRYMHRGWDTDNHRVYYQRKNETGSLSLYCLQWDGPMEGVNFYRCTPAGEPEFKCAKPPAYEFDKLEYPHAVQI